MSERQKNTALRVAKIPKPVFEDAVESFNPPTVTRRGGEGMLLWKSRFPRKPPETSTYEGRSPRLTPVLAARASWIARAARSKIVPNSRTGASGYFWAMAAQSSKYSQSPIASPTSSHIVHLVDARWAGVASGRPARAARRVSSALGSGGLS